MSIEMQEYAFIISRGEQGEYDSEELEEAFLAELHAGHIGRPHRIRGSSWGTDGECGAYFFRLPTVVDDVNAFYVGMGRAAENDWRLEDSYHDIVKLPSDWRNALEAARADG